MLAPQPRRQKRPKAANPRGRGKSTEPVFLSYASQDVDAAGRKWAWR